MTVSAVICEFNPFHNGHKYLLDEVRKGSDYVVCIMSGNFVQRGSFALCDKYLRAENAVKSGADLVIELPLPYAVGTAETFARGAVGMLNNLGIVDKLCFGSEKSLDEIKAVMQMAENPKFKERLEKNMKSGLSYPDAFFEAAGKNVLTGGNDILAFEYLRQLKLFCSKITPVAVKRKGNAHGSETPVGEFASASFIRDNIQDEKIQKEYMPSLINKEDISQPEKLDLAILSKLRQMSENDFEKIADVTEGLEYRLKRAALQAKGLDDFFENVRTKRYTLSKIRRIVLCSYLGVTKNMQKYIPSYVSVLACNEKGTKLLPLIKEKGGIAPIIRYCDTESLLFNDKKLYEFTALCDDIFGLTLPEIRNAGYDMTHRFNVIR